MLRRLARLCRSAPARLFWRQTTLDPFFEEADGGVSLRACVVLNGIARPAVAVTAGSEAICRTYPPAGSVLVVHCGVEGPADSRVRFDVSVNGSRIESCLAGVGRWVSLRVPAIGGSGHGPVLIAFRTSVIEGQAAGVQPYWGSPALHWRRSLADVGRTFVRAVRQYGLGGMVARLAAHGDPNALDSPAAYGSWLDARAPSAADLDRMRRDAAAASPPIRFAVLVIGGDHAARVRTIESLAQQAYSHWEAWIWWPNAATSRDASAHGADARLRIATDAATETDVRNAMARESSAGYVVSLDAGDELVPHALLEFAWRAAAPPGPDILYSDEDRQLSEGLGDPRLKPGWSPEYLQSRMYLGKVVAMRREAVLGVGGYRHGMESAHDYDVALRISAVGDAVMHVPAILCHGRAIEPHPTSVRLGAERRALQHFCQTTGRHAIVTAGMSTGVWRIRTRYQDTPHVTIVIPTDARSAPTASGSHSMISQCIRSIIERTSYANYDLVIADNGRFPGEAAALLDGVRHTRVTYRWSGDFNFSRKINFAVAHAQGEYLLLLNDDVEVINGEWLTAMLEYARQERIGAVGAKLFYPDGRLQHIGVVTGVCGIAAHLLHQHPAGSAGCGEIAVAARNCSAVTGACLLTRRKVYQDVGGFDERLAVDFNDVDFCLRVRAAGYRIVFTPDAKLYHHESGSFGLRVQHARDIQAMREIWGSALDHDPYYNPNLSREFTDCRLSRLS